MSDSSRSEKAFAALSAIYKAFTNDDDIPVTYFESHISNLQSNFQLLYFFHKKINSTTDGFDPVHVFTRITDTGPKGTYCHQLLFFILLTNFFADCDESSIDRKTAETVLETFSSLLNHVYQQEVQNKHLIFRNAAKSIRALMDRDPNLVFVVSDWIASGKHTPAFVLMTKYLKWPKEITSEAIKQALKSTFAFADQCSAPILEQIYSEAVTGLVLSLKTRVRSDDDDDDDENKDEYNKNDNDNNSGEDNNSSGENMSDIFEHLKEMRRARPKTTLTIAQFAFYTLYHSHAARAAKEVSELISAIRPGIDFCPALRLMSLVLARCVSIDIGVLGLFLTAASKNLEVLTDKDSTYVSQILSYFYVNSPEQFIEILKNSLLAIKSSAGIFSAVIRFVDSKSIDYKAFLSSDNKNIAVLVKNLIKTCFENFHSPLTISPILEFVLRLVPIYQSQLSVTASHEDMLAFMKSGSDPVTLCYGRIWRLCFLLFAQPDFPEVRLLAHRLLDATSDLFKVENDDWEDYELDAQPFAIQYFNETMFFMKKIGLPPTDTIDDFLLMHRHNQQQQQQSQQPQQKLSEKQLEKPNVAPLAYDGVLYLARRMTISRQKFAGKLLRETLGMSDRSPYLIDISATLMAPILLRKLNDKSIQLAAIFDKARSHRRYSALALLPLDHVLPCLELLKSSTDILAFESITTAALAGGSATVELITAELQFADTLCAAPDIIVANPSSFAHSVKNIGEQCIACESLTELPQTYRNLHMLCFMNAQKDTINQHYTIESLFTYLLASAKFSVEIDTKEIHYVLSLPSVHSSAAMVGFFSRLEKMFPEEKTKAIFESPKIYSIVPDRVAHSIFVRGCESVADLAFFCYFICNKASPDVVKSFKKFVSSERYRIDIKDPFDTHAIADALIEKDQHLPDFLLKKAREFLSGNSSFSVLQTSLVDVLTICARHCKQSSFSINEVIQTAIDLQRVSTSAVLDYLWDTIMANPESSIGAFEFLIADNTIHISTIVRIYDICNFKPEVLEWVRATMLTSVGDARLLHIHFTLSTRGEMDRHAENKAAINLAYAAIMLQVGNYTLRSTALDYIKRSSSKKDDNFPNGEETFAQILFCLRLVDKDEAPTLIKGIFKLLYSSPKNVATVLIGLSIVFHKSFRAFMKNQMREAFSANLLVHFTSTTSITKIADTINTTNTNNIIDTANVAKPAAKKESDGEFKTEVSQLGNFLGDFFSVLIQIFDRNEKDLKPQIIINLIYFFIPCVEIRSDYFNDKLSLLISKVTERLPEEVDSKFFSKIGELLYHGDEYILRLLQHAKANCAKMEKSSSIFWAKIDDPETRIDMTSDGEILESIKKAIVFGGTVTAQKVFALLTRDRAPPNDAAMAELFAFMILSNEIKSPTSLIVTDTIIKKLRKNFTVESTKECKKYIKFIDDIKILYQ